MEMIDPIDVEDVVDEAIRERFRNLNEVCRSFGHTTPTVEERFRLLEFLVQEVDDCPILARITLRRGGKQKSLLRLATIVSQDLPHWADLSAMQTIIEKNPCALLWQSMVTAWLQNWR